ncbi:MAG: hypothetical protein H7336_15160, partial [Bacteriovorax sp.]|nr:hypothetical protein [Bacteriovorax sp.]
MAVIPAIGDMVNAFTGNFNGQNNRIENFRINCPSVSADGFGLFRNTQGGVFSGLTINKGVVECDKDSYTNNKLGLLVGAASNNKFKNIRAFGHISGDQFVGGIVGYAANNSTFEDVHFEGGMNGSNSVGGLAGFISGTSNQDFIIRSSFSGEIGSRCGGTPCDSIVGGLVGDAYYSASVGTIKESTAKLKRLEGSKIIGGLAGRTNLININDSIVTGVMSSNAMTDGTTHKLKMGGLVGEGELGQFNRNVIVMMRKSNRKTSDTSEGVVLGFVTSTPPICPSSTTRPGRNFSVGVSVGSLACNTDSATTIAQITDSTFYFTTSIASDYPLWSWPANDQGSGRDIPRLAWEVTREATVPYLKKECSGLYSTPAGSGTQADPYSICSASQFASMGIGYYYKLKKNLIFAGASVAQKSAGVYYLDGDGYALIDFQISVVSSGNNGLFKELSAQSEIKNLAIIFGKLSTADNYTVAGNTSIGLLAGSNYGLIENVVTSDSESSFTGLDFFTNNVSFISGGLVGTNQIGGVISNSELDNSVLILRPHITVSSLIVGGIAGSNAGQITIVKSHGTVERSMGQ